MSDKNAEKDDEQTVRKRVQVVEEIVEDKPSQEEQNEEAEAAEGKEDYNTEHQAGSKVRVARSTDGLDAPRNTSSKDADAPDKKKPGRRSVTFAKKEEEAEDGDADNNQDPKTSASDQPTSSSNKPGKQPKPKIEYKVAEPDVSTSDFEALLAGGGGSDGGASSAPQSLDLVPGDRITGTVAAIGAKFIFVSVGSTKTEGVSTREDFETEEGEIEVEVGDEIDFYVLSMRGDEIQLGKKLSGRQGALEAVRTACATGVPIEGRVAGTNKGGYEVMIGGVRAFCPMSQIELSYTEDPQVHMDATYRFRVEKVEERGKNVVVSRTALLEEERAAKREETLETLTEGEIVSGKVTRVVDFGAFIDLGGVEGLAHVSELAHGNVGEPSDVVSSGDTVQVKILNIEEDKKGQLRIGLSIKQTQGDPWDEVNDKFSVGQEVEGEVVRLAPFGAFVQLSAGLDGLVHVSEMSWKKHVKHPKDILSTGEMVRVQIQDIDQVRQRIGLSLKAVEGDPWDTAADRYSVGMEITGTVENVEDFGAFVRLDSGITALIPRSEMDLPSGVTPHRKYEVGEEATARVLNVDSGERKMALTEKAAADIEAPSGGQKSSKSKKSKKAGGRGYSDDTGDDGGFGTLGDLLGDKLQKD
jgi:small subunit ribosomal protein S1